MGGASEVCDNCHPLVMSGVVTEDNGEGRSSQKHLVWYLGSPLSL